ncbi:MAG: hypothetical protein IJ247_04385 [Bacilli bacterium]|nr:hypothetical protein [Bacilli bacterium]
MKVLSIDISASSGRLIVVDHTKNNFEFEEIFRFKNEMKMENGHYRWDQDYILENIKKGLVEALKKHPDIASIGIDTWGVDYVLIDENGKSIDKTIAYRDPRNAEAAERLFKKHSYWEIYKESGIQYCPFNTIFQLFDDIHNRKMEFSKFLLMPDYLSYGLTGEKRLEVTNLSTGAIYDPVKKEVSPSLLDMIGCSKDKLCRIIRPGETIGMVDVEGKKIPLIAVASHDTASAVGSLFLDEDTAYISSGTWSLLGCEEKSPIITKEGYKANFTNEIGINDNVCYLKNIMGLFMIQELKKEYEVTRPGLSFQNILDEATAVQNEERYVDVDYPPFSYPEHMKDKVIEYLEKTNQSVENLSLGNIARIIYQSLAVKYAEELKNLETLRGKRFKRLVLVGGATNVPLLEQAMADLMGIEILIGEKEATVAGNALCQFIANKEFSSLEGARKALWDRAKHQIFIPNKDFDSKKVIEAYKAATNI